jgi:hypothetical protein
MLAVMTRQYQKPLHIDMPFDEALERFAQTDLEELPDNVKLRRRKKKAEGTEPSASEATADRPAARRKESD